MNRIINDEIQSFNIMLGYYNYQLIDLNENYYDISQLLAHLEIEDYSGIYINKKGLKKMFISSIDGLNDKTKLFYNQRMLHTNVIRTSYFENGYAEIVGNIKSNTIYLTKNRLKDIDFVAFAHEFGHVPYIINGAKLDYYEYSEVLAMFFEYLGWKYINSDNYDELFLKTRFKIIEDEAINVLDIYELLYGDNSLHDKNLLNNIRDCYKYILSFEYINNLIDIYNQDNKYVMDEIAKIVDGSSSFKELEKKLNFDISSCNKILKLTRNYRH